MLEVVLFLILTFKFLHVKLQSDVILYSLWYDVYQGVFQGDIQTAVSSKNITIYSHIIHNKTSINLKLNLLRDLLTDVNETESWICVLTLLLIISSTHILFKSLLIVLKCLIIICIWFYFYLHFILY